MMTMQSSEPAGTRPDNSGSGLEKYLFGAYLALLFWVPLPFASVMQWSASIIEFWVFGLSLLWILEYMKSRVEFTPVFFRAKPVLMLFALWLVFVMMQFLPLPPSLVFMLSPESAKINALAGNKEWLTLSVDTYATTTSWMKSASYVLFFALSLLLVNSRARLENLAYVLIFSGLFQAVYGALMTMSGYEYIIGNATGTFINRNHLAGYLEMCLSVSMGLMISRLGGKGASNWRQKTRNVLRLFFSQKMKLRLSLLLMVIALVLTRSRMGNSAFFSSMMAAGIIGLIFSRHATRSMVILLASLVVIDIFIVGSWFGVDQVVERIENSSVINDADRVDLFSKGLQQWRDYPLTGSGLGSYDIVFPRYKDEELSGRPEHAHNDYVEFGSESGIVGIILLGLCVLFSFIAALFAQYRRRDPLMRGMAFASTMAIIALLIHSTVDFNLQIPANAMTFMVILALGWISLALDSGRRRSKSTTDAAV